MLELNLSSNSVVVVPAGREGVSFPPPLPRGKGWGLTTKKAIFRGSGHEKIDIFVVRRL